MGSSVTAVVLSAHDYFKSFDRVELLVSRQIIRNSAQLQAARFDAIKRVRTDYFFFLDDDDSFSAEICRLCVSVGNANSSAIVYTDELINETVRRSGLYSQDAHIKDALYIHHLALCNTELAIKAVDRLPRGNFCPEFMLYWELAKQGASYVPEIGYRWVKRPSGMHNWPETSISQMRSKLWSKQHSRLSLEAYID